MGDYMQELAAGRNDDERVAAMNILQTFIDYLNTRLPASEQSAAEAGRVAEAAMYALEAAEGARQVAEEARKIAENAHARAQRVVEDDIQRLRSLQAVMQSLQ